jgi:hypothetical protein
MWMILLPCQKSRVLVFFSFFLSACLRLASKYYYSYYEYIELSWRNYHHFDHFVHIQMDQKYTTATTTILFSFFNQTIARKRTVQLTWHKKENCSNLYTHDLSRVTIEMNGDYLVSSLHIYFIHSASFLFLFFFSFLFCERTTYWRLNSSYINREKERNRWTIWYFNTERKRNSIRCLFYI